MRYALLLLRKSSSVPPTTVKAGIKWGRTIKERIINMEQIKVLSSWLQVLGLPTIFALSCWCAKKCVQFSKNLNILQSAQKAQMRSQLLNQYYHIKERTFVYADELDDWMNQYQAYHELVGVNGVLDSRKDELTHMPSEVRD